MPELPEVETVRRTLQPIIGAKIEAVWNSGKALRMGQLVPMEALQTLCGKRIAGIRRLGKYLLVDVSNAQSILVHLGMSGRFRIQPCVEAVTPHTHVIFQLNQKRDLRYSDPRRFGQIDVVTPGKEREHPALAVLGPDPIEEPTLATGAHLYAKSRGKSTSLKAFVLDQSIIAGVGNIYASEALWKIGLRPSVRAHRLSEAKADQLANAIKEVLHFALEHGGTSLRDFVNADGATGEHADYLLMYGREGEPCPRCNATIKRCIQQGRATYFCPSCQKS
jgi:formamidopyrimidine-DNA glycosylase